MCFFMTSATHSSTVIVPSTAQLGEFFCPIFLLLDQKLRLCHWAQAQIEECPLGSPAKGVRIQEGGPDHNDLDLDLESDLDDLKNTV